MGASDYFGWGKIVSEIGDQDIGALARRQPLHKNAHGCFPSSESLPQLLKPYRVRKTWPLAPYVEWSGFVAFCWF